MASQYVTFIIQFAVSVIVSRFFLSPADYGLFSIAMAAAMMVSILQDFGLTRYISGSAELDDPHRRLCVSVAIIFALIIGAILLAAAYPVSWFYAQPKLFPLLAIIASSYLFVPLSVVPYALLARDMNFRALFAVNCGGALANAACALILCWLGFSAFSLAWALVAQAIVRAIIGQYMSPCPARFPFKWAEAMPILRFGSASSVLFITGAIGIRTPDLIIGRILPLAAVGLYSRASSLAGQFHALVTGAIGGVFYPAFARLRDQGGPLGRPYARVVSGYTAIIWASMAGLAVAAEPLVRLLYGEKWLAVAPLLRWIAISEIAFVALPLHMELPILLGRMRALIRRNMLDTAASVILLFAGAAISLEMAAASRLAYGAVWLVIYARFMRHLVGFEWPVLLKIYAKSLCGAIIAIVPLLVGYQFWAPPAAMSFLQLLVLSGAGALLWLGTLFVIRHPAAEEVRGMAITLLAPLRSRLAR
jgi:O-antigen/teichoic acid export membrane protein